MPPATLWTSTEPGSIITLSTDLHSHSNKEVQHSPVSRQSRLHICFRRIVLLLQGLGQKATASPSRIRAPNKDTRWLRPLGLAGSDSNTTPLPYRTSPRDIQLLTIGRHGIRAIDCSHKSSSKSPVEFKHSGSTARIINRK